MLGCFPAGIYVMKTDSSATMLHHKFVHSIFQEAAEEITSPTQGMLTNSPERILEQLSPSALKKDEWLEEQVTADWIIFAWCYTFTNRTFSGVLPIGQMECFFTDH